MTNKETNTRAVTSMSINSRRFVDNLANLVEVYKFCVTVTKSPRVSGNIIKRLSALGIEE